MLHTRVEEGAPRRLGLEELHTMVEDGALGRQGAEEAPRTLVLYKLEELHMMAFHRQGRIHLIHWFLISWGSSI